MKRVRPWPGETRIVWSPEMEELICEQCRSVLHWNFGFRRCPYCRREIVRAEERRVKIAHV